MKLATIIGAAFAATLAMSAAAQAATGWATADVPLWHNPATHSGQMTVIPSGAKVEVYRCAIWCEVIYGPYHGWAAADAIATLHGPFFPMFVSPAETHSGEWKLKPVYVRPAPAYIASSTASRCASWHCYDQPYGSWYADKIFYFQGRWVDRPDSFMIVGQ